jgi:hypothetical protein
MELPMALHLVFMILPVQLLLLSRPRIVMRLVLVLTFHGQVILAFLQRAFKVKAISWLIN